VVGYISSSSSSSMYLCIGACMESSFRGLLMCESARQMPGGSLDSEAEWMEGRERELPVLRIWCFSFSVNLSIYLYLICRHIHIYIHD
jgi:hypothetical protein